MKDDYYTYPDIEDSGSDGFPPEDVFSSDSQPTGYDTPPSRSDTPFRVTLNNDEMYSNRRPTGRPASESFNRPAGQDRTPRGRRVTGESGFGEPDPYSQRPGPYQAPQSPPTSRTYYGGESDRFSGEGPQGGGDFRQRPPQPPVSRTARRPQPSSNQGQTQQRAKRERDKAVSSKSRRRKKPLVIVLCVFLALLLIIGASGFAMLGKINYDTSTRGKNEYIAASELAHSGRVKNILIIGSDARSDNKEMGMRSDSMILASIDSKNRQLKLTSILRDSLVKIPARDSWNKLNASFSFGGAKMTIDTIEYNFKVKIDSYVIIDFEIFTQFIDAIGGIDVDGITEAEVNWLKANVQGINIHPGKSHLTGGAALWYCRVRKIDSDFKRTERQRKVVGAVIEKVKHTNPFTTFNAIRKVLPLITTDIDRASLLGLGANAVLRYMHYDMCQMQIPVDGTWWDKTYSIGAVLEMNIDKNAEALKDFIYNKQEKEAKGK